MHRFEIALVTSKILLLGYAIDLLIYYNFLFSRSWFILLVVFLLASGIRFIIIFQLLTTNKKNGLNSLFVSIIIAIIIKFFTIGDPIFDAMKKLAQSWEMTFIFILGGISIFLIENISLKVLTRNYEQKWEIDNLKNQLLDDWMHE